MTFQVIAGLTALWLVKTRRLSGCVFSLYMIAYGLFRFFSEFLRETPKSFGSLSFYQWLSLLMVVLGAGFLIKRTWLPPDDWKEGSRDVLPEARASG